MTNEEISQLAQILYKKIEEWVAVTPEEDRQDSELANAIDEYELPENLQGEWEYTNEWTGESYIYDVEAVLNACLYSATYDNEHPFTLEDIEGLIEQGFENLDCVCEPVCDCDCD